MYDFTSFFNYWDRLIEDWMDDPDNIRFDVYLSKYDPSSNSPLYQGKGFDYYKYRPEPYLGNPEDCCAVMLNLNPGFGIPSDVDEKTHPDYRLQHCEAVDKIRYDAKGFVPYLSGEFVNDPKKCVKSREDIPGGVFWWNGTYKESEKKCTGGRIDYIHHLYNLYFGTKPDTLPFVLEICPWRSYNFSLTHLFPDGIPADPADELVRTIDDYIITPALQATKGQRVLPFVICIGSAVKELANVLNLETKPEWCWTKDSGMEKWPRRKNGKKVERSYTLYHRDGCYLLNLSAPGSNKPPGKGTFQTEMEPEIIKHVKYIINHNTSETMSPLLKKLFAKTQAEPLTENKIQKVRVEFDIEEHDYQALGADQCSIGDSYAYNGEDGVSNLEVYVDGELLPEEVLEDHNSKYTDYVEDNLSWDAEEEVAYFGYVCNEQHHVYEFETDAFDYNKLVFLYNCFDVTFEDADYSAEEQRLTVLYDGKELENLQEPDGEGDFEQQWARYDDEDEDCCYEEEDIETILNEKYDQVFNDGNTFSVQLNEKWGIVDSNGNELISPRYDWMGDEYIEDVIIVGINGVGIGYVNNEGVEIVAPKYSQAQDFENDYAAVCLKGKWGFIDRTGKEVVSTVYDDVNNFEDGKAEVTLNGETFFVDTEGQRIGAKTESETDTSDFEIKSLDTDKLWADVICKLPENIQISVSAPSGRAYFFIKSKNGPEGADDFKYVVNYHVRASLCAVSVETLNGGIKGKKAIQKYIDIHNADSIIKEISPQQGAKNKDKWAWIMSAPLAGKSYGTLVQWYMDTIVEFYRFFERA